jgi:hypothetical protein
VSSEHWFCSKGQRAAFVLSDLGRWWKMLSQNLKLNRRQRQIAEMILALRTSPMFTGRLHRWQQQG